MTEESFRQEIELYTTSVSFDAKEKQTNEARPSKKIPIWLASAVIQSHTLKTSSFIWTKLKRMKRF